MQRIKYLPGKKRAPSDYVDPCLFLISSINQICLYNTTKLRTFTLNHLQEARFFIPIKAIVRFEIPVKFAASKKLVVLCKIRIERDVFRK